MLPDTSGQSPQSLMTDLGLTFFNRQCPQATFILSKTTSNHHIKPHRHKYMPAPIAPVGNAIKPCHDGFPRTTLHLERPYSRFPVWQAIKLSDEPKHTTFSAFQSYYECKSGSKPENYAPATPSPNSYPRPGSANGSQTYAAAREGCTWTNSYTDEDNV